MKVKDLKSLLSLPLLSGQSADDGNVEFLYGHSELGIVQVQNGSASPSPDGKALTITFVLEEKRDLSDQEKHDQL